MGAKTTREKWRNWNKKNRKKNKEEIDFDSFFEKHFNFYCCYFRFAYYVLHCVHYMGAQAQADEILILFDKDEYRHS